MRNFIIFNGKSFMDYGVYISGDGTFNAPERDTTKIEIPGRNGTLTVDKGRYKNLPVKYPAFIVHDFNANIEGLRNFLLTQSGYGRLEDTYHPEEFRKAKISGGFTTKPIAELYAGEFDLEFDCYPQRFLKSGELPVSFTAAGNLINKYLTEAKPLIRAYGTGTFSIGSKSVQITSADTYTDIDCDLQEAFKDTLATNCNNNIILTDGEFPSLIPGDNLITLSGLSGIEITPRWWML